MRIFRPRPTIVELFALVLALTIALTFIVPERFRIAGHPVVDARFDMNAIGTGLEMYRFDTGHYPATAQGLFALVTRPASHPFNWRGPYLLPRVPHDPWGRPYGYSRADDRTGEAFVLWSYGADRRPGGTGAGADVVFRP
jgi:general secretion pathway protein G